MDTRNLPFTWSHAVAEFNSLIESSARIDSDENKTLAEDFAYLLKDLFEYIIKKAKIRDKWTFGWNTTSHGVSLYARSATQNHNYVFGVYQQEIYLSSSILDAQNLKYMNNRFWEIFSRLSILDNFGFKDNAGLPNHITVDTRTGKADMYRLIRNYTILEEHQPTSTIDIGRFEAFWNISESLESLLVSAIQMIQGIHKLNYLLYRCEYQRLKARGS